MLWRVVATDERSFVRAVVCSTVNKSTELGRRPDPRASDPPSLESVTMSVRAHEAKIPTMSQAQMAHLAAQPAVQEMEMVDVGEGATGFATVRQDAPLRRKVVASVRASLAELITRSNAGGWMPNEAQLEKMFKQRKFLNVQGGTAMLGDLRSIVVHSVTAASVNSSFPIALGTQITGVSEQYFSSTAKAFSYISPARANTTNPVTLQKDDVSVAYDFAQRYPGFTADNLETNGIHAVPQRRFVLVALNHPLVTAIHENQSRLQMSEIQQMPDQLIKISTSLYNTLMPLVKDQVRAQIKVADFTRLGVSIEPADFASWNEVSDALTKEAVAPIKAAHRRALKRVGNSESDVAKVDAHFQEKIEEAMHEVSSTPYEFALELDIEYNFLQNEEDNTEE